MDELIEILSYTISFLPAIILLYSPFRKDIKGRKIVYFVLGTTVLMGVHFGTSFLFIEGLGEYELFFKLDIAVLYSLLLGLALIILPHRRMALAFNFGIVGIIILCISAVSYYLVDIFKTQHRIALLAILYFGLVIVSWIPVWKIINATIQPILNIKEDDSYWRKIWMVPVCMLLACACSTPLNGHAKTLFEIICRMMCGFTALFVCRYIIHDYESLRERHRLNLELATQKEYYKALSAKVQNDRKARHDFRHEVMAVSAFVENDDKEGLRKYCDRLLKVCGFGSEIPFTGHSVVDGILYRYYLVARECGVHFAVEGTITGTNVSELDLCLLLGNGLENSMDACQRIPEKDRFIRVEVENSETLLSITICNSFDGVLKRKKGKILSRKRENEEGIGLKSMQEICEKYGGTLHIKQENKTFVLMLLLNNDTDIVSETK